MSAADVLGPALAQAVRELVREELRGTRAVAPASPVLPELLSPEKAAKRFKGKPSADTIRSLIHRGLLARRLAGEGRGRPSYLVTVDEVLAALVASGKPVPSSTAPVDLEAVRARAREKGRGGR